MTLPSPSSRTRRPSLRSQSPNVGCKRLQLILGDHAAEGRHLNRLTIEEEASQAICLEPLRTPDKNPLPELVVVEHELREIAAVPRRYVALQAAWIAARAKPARSVAAKATEPFGDCVSVPGLGILRNVCRRHRAQVSDEVAELRIRETSPPSRHSYRRGLERLPAFAVLPQPPWHAVEDPVTQRFRIDLIEIREMAREHRRDPWPFMATEAAIGQR